MIFLHIFQKGARAVILSPTRELAVQTLKFTKEVKNDYRKLATFAQITNCSYTFLFTVIYNFVFPTFLAWKIYGFKNILNTGW